MAPKYSYCQLSKRISGCWRCMSHSSRRRPRCAGNHSAATDATASAPTGTFPPSQVPAASSALRLRQTVMPGIPGRPHFPGGGGESARTFKAPLSFRSFLRFRVEQGRTGPSGTFQVGRLVRRPGEPHVKC